MNRYKQRNFDHHHDNFIIPQPDVTEQILNSNGMYDAVRGSEVIYVPDDGCGMRRVDQVELLMSRDPMVSNLVPPDVKAGLRANLMSQPRSNVQMSEEASLVAPQCMGLEPDERANVAKSIYNKMESNAYSLINSEPSTTTVQEPSSTPPEPSPAPSVPISANG